MTAVLIVGGALAAFIVLTWVLGANGIGVPAGSTGEQGFTLRGVVDYWRGVFR